MIILSYDHLIPKLELCAAKLGFKIVLFSVVCRVPGKTQKTNYLAKILLTSDYQSLRPIERAAKQVSDGECGVRIASTLCDVSR